MRIVADADILSVRECFSALGELELVEGRSIKAEHLRNADALLVRSITRVDAGLLADSNVRFVGTATSGIDHLDTDYLKRHDIYFCHARGSNANAVVEYCLAVLALLTQRTGWNYGNKRFSVIGAGHVGGMFARKLCALQFQCVAYDPLIETSKQAELESQGVQFVAWQEALQADVISFHVPLTRSGGYPTYHQLSTKELRSLPRDCLLINASRGAVVDNAELAKVLNTRPDLMVALDVWEGEPDLNQALLDQVHVATPHIAGYSVEAKLNATDSLLARFCHYFQVDRPVKSGTRDRQPQRSVAGELLSPGADSLCSRLILDVFPLERIDRELRDNFAANPGQGAAAFDLLRKKLAARREFSAYQVEDSTLTADQQRVLRILGFTLNQH